MRRLRRIPGWSIPCGAIGLYLALQVVSATLVPQGHDLRVPAVVTPGFADVTYGDTGAPETILVLISATCAHCRAWEATQIPALERGLLAGGRVRLVLRPYPLDRAALSAAAVVACLSGARRAAAQHAVMGRDASTWGGWDERAAARAAGLVGMDAASAVTCATDRGTEGRILDTARAAHDAWGVEGTPTLVFGRRVVPGSLDAQGIARLLADASGPIR